MNMCEAIDKDGDKYLTRNSVEGPKTVQETLAGTGKYEGMVRTGTAESLGQFPTIKQGTFQGCNLDRKLQAEVGISASRSGRKHGVKQPREPAGPRRHGVLQEGAASRGRLIPFGRGRARP